MIEKFDVRDVKANPARFDIDKAISINAEHIRMLEPQDFLNRAVPYLKRDGVVSADSWDALTDRGRLYRAFRLCQEAAEGIRSRSARQGHRRA